MNRSSMTLKNLNPDCSGAVCWVIGGTSRTNQHRLNSEMRLCFEANCGSFFRLWPCMFIMRDSTKYNDDQDLQRFGIAPLGMKQENRDNQVESAGVVACIPRKLDINILAVIFRIELCSVVGLCDLYHRIVSAVGLSCLQGPQ